MAPEAMVMCCKETGADDGQALTLRPMLCYGHGHLTLEPVEDTLNY